MPKWAVRMMYVPYPGTFWLAPPSAQERTDLCVEGPLHTQITAGCLDPLLFKEAFEIAHFSFHCLSLCFLGLLSGPYVSLDILLFLHDQFTY